MRRGDWRKSHAPSASVLRLYVKLQLLMYGVMNYLLKMSAPKKNSRMLPCQTSHP